MRKDKLKLVVFTMETANAAYEYGIPIGQVHEITRPGKSVKIPGMPPFVEGVMNLRGEVIPIIDFKKRFELGNTVTKDTTRIIVVNMTKQKCGVLVDDVLEIVDVSAEDIEEAPKFADTVKRDYILGIGKVAERLIIALDVIKVLSDNEQEELLEVGA